MAVRGGVVIFAWLVYGQTEPTPRFEVASVKPAGTGRPGGGLVTGHGRMTVASETLKRCIMGAYGLGPNQIAGGPAWLDSDRFEIVAKSERPEDGDAALMVMLQTLLADRFKLSVHRETRTMTALVLEVARSGPKLEKAGDGEATTRSNSAFIDARAITMSRLAEVLSRQTNLVVVDSTGLKGAFNLKLWWRPESPRATVTGVDEAMERPSLFDALQQQLGLRLESRKMPIEILVIDHAEKPSEN
jgi:uncharacterized protein (TIGR03435 family)